MVGDSIGNVIYGYGNTIPVSLEEIESATVAVKRATERAMVISDLPYGTYHLSQKETVKNALRLMKHGGAEAIKLEGGQNRVKLVKRLVNEEIPVVAHIGLTPQSVYKLGGYRVQGRTAEQAKRLIEDAKALEEAGAFAIVLELVPREVAEIITKEVKISTIGIGAGSECDIQVLVLHDLLGMTFGRQPRFVRKYADLRQIMTESIQTWTNDVKNGNYPNESESYGLTAETKAELENLLK